MALFRHSSSPLVAEATGKAGRESPSDGREYGVLGQCSHWTIGSSLGSLTTFVPFLMVPRPLLWSRFPPASQVFGPEVEAAGHPLCSSGRSGICTTWRGRLWCV